MSARSGGFDPTAYRPTSVNSLISPNPVEPHAVPQKHPLNKTTTDTSNPDLLRVLLDSRLSNGRLNRDEAASPERPVKRQKSGDVRQSDLDLPKPPVRQGSQRLRIPPTLSGLHQPPPDAGLLPSISVQKPQDVAVLESPPATEIGAESDAAKSAPTTASISTEAQVAIRPLLRTSAARPKRNKWTEEETACLLKGVARFGIGNWTKILQCPDYVFLHRTALDLKDRFRVCCPDDYKTTRRSKQKTAKFDGDEINQDGSSSVIATEAVRRGRKPEKKTSSDLQELGITEAFASTRRRRRTAYSAAEDEAILRGYRQYGNSWSDIQQDKDLCLGKRTATDLRDRLRTRYPEEYAKIGRLLRSNTFSEATGRTAEHRESHNVDSTDSRVPASITATALQTKVHAPGRPIYAIAQRDGNNDSQPTIFDSEKALPSNLLSSDDVFFGLDLDMEASESERITLDRRILDWPSGLATTSGSTANNTSIDAFASLNLPKPSASVPNSGQVTGANATLSALLPSLAAITSACPTDGVGDQLELPSLLAGFGALESDSADARTNSNLMSLDELLS